MNSMHWLLFFCYLLCRSTILGFDGMVVPKESNEVLDWEYRQEQQQQKPSVAKYVDEKYQNSIRNSSRRLFGRHVCTHSKVIMVPVRDVQSYCKPVYQSYLRRCDHDVSSGGYCTGYRVVYELAYRNVEMLVPKTHSVYTCCPGWSQMIITATDCKRAVCREPCRNGGFCTKPDHCICPPGWTGKTCETDVDECSKQRHGCHHKCINVPGAYKCDCKEGYTIQEDKKSCAKDNMKRNSENDIELLKRIDHLQERLNALENWQKKLLTDGPDSRHQRDDRINSLSEQMAILEETLEECSCYRKGSIPMPRPQK